MAAKADKKLGISRPGKEIKKKWERRRKKENFLVSWEWNLAVEQVERAYLRERAKLVLFYNPSGTL